MMEISHEPFREARPPCNRPPKTAEPQMDWRHNSSPLIFPLIFDPGFPGVMTAGERKVRTSKTTTNDFAKEGRRLGAICRCDRAHSSRDFNDGSILIEFSLSAER